MTNDNATYPTLNDDAFFAAFLDTLIPPSAESESRGTLPAAGTLGLGPEVVTAIQSSSAIAATVEAGLAALRTAALEANSSGFEALDLPARVELIESQLEAHPNLIRAVITPLYFAYYQHPTVLIGLGIPPRPPFPEGYEVEATDPELLELLRSRGS